MILQFGLKKPAFRICVNTPTTHGSIGLTTGLDPAMTLGCGGWGGNITSDNITPRHLLNIKRLAYEVRPAVVSPQSDPVARATTALPKAPVKPVEAGIPAAALASRIDQFLASKGYRPDGPHKARPTESSSSVTVTNSSVQPNESPADFICEDDVRTALKTGRKLLIGEKTIVTPSARDLGEAEKVFVMAGWPS